MLRWHVPHIKTGIKDLYYIFAPTQLKQCGWMRSHGSEEEPLNIWQERLSRGWNGRLRGQNVRLALWSLDNVTISTQFHQGQNHFKRPSAPYRILLFVVNACHIEVIVIFIFYLQGLPGYYPVGKLQHVKVVRLVKEVAFSRWVVKDGFICIALC